MTRTVQHIGPLCRMQVDTVTMYRKRQFLLMLFFNIINIDLTYLI